MKSSLDVFDEEAFADPEDRRIREEFEDDLLRHLLCGPGKHALLEARSGREKRYLLTVLPDSPEPSFEVTRAMIPTYERFFHHESNLDFCGFIWRHPIPVGARDEAFALACELLTHAAAAISHVRTREDIRALALHARALLCNLLEKERKSRKPLDWDITKFAMDLEGGEYVPTHVFSTFMSTHYGPADQRGDLPHTRSAAYPALITVRGSALNKIPDEKREAMVKETCRRNVNGFTGQYWSA